MTESNAGDRLQKVLAAAGLGSRRACEVLIEQGRVTIDGRRARLGDRVDPERNQVHVDGERIPTARSLIVLAMNKPAGVLTTMSDDRGRPCVGDYLTQREERLFHVGRLDADTEGLLLITNDGELSNRLTHPSHGVAKTYLATVNGPVRGATLTAMRRGVELPDEERPVTVDSARVVQALPAEVLIEVVLHEGRHHVVRRLLDAVGHPVLRLVRTQVGPIRLGQQRPGTVRVLNPAEARSLYTAVSL
jgi:23S rRNA pseudouridine2605 synthase